MAEDGHTIDDVGGRGNQLGIRTEIGVLFENSEHAFGIGGLGQFLTIQTYGFSCGEHARRIDETAARVYPTMKFQILFRSQYFACRKLDERALSGLHGKNRVRRKHQFQLLVGPHERVNIRGRLPAERTVEVVELQQGNIADRISDCDLAWQLCEPRRQLRSQVEIGDRIAFVALDGILVGTKLGRTRRRCYDADERHQPDHRRTHYCDTVPSGAVSSLKAAANSARVESLLGALNTSAAAPSSTALPCRMTNSLLASAATTRRSCEM